MAVSPALSCTCFVIAHPPEHQCLLAGGKLRFGGRTFFAPNGGESVRARRVLRGGIPMSKAGEHHRLASTHYHDAAHHHQEAAHLSDAGSHDAAAYHAAIAAEHQRTADYHAAEAAKHAVAKTNEEKK